MERINSIANIENIKKRLARAGVHAGFASLAIIGGGARVAIEAANPQVAEAADPNCRVGTRIESYTFFDMAQVVPEMGRRHILDMGIDPRAGSAAGFTVDAVSVTYKKGDRDKPDYHPLASTNIVRDQQNNVGRGELQFTTSCNTTATTSEGKVVPALRYKLVSNLDPNNDQFEVVTPNDRRSVVAFGSEIKKLEDFLRIADEKPEVIKDLSPATKERLRQSIREAIQKQETEKVKPQEGRPTEPPVGVQPNVLRAVESVADVPAKVIANAVQPPFRWGIDAVGWLVAWLVALGLLLDKPATRLQRVRLNRPRSRIRNTVAWPVREVRYRLGPLRAHNQGLANNTIAAGTLPPARGYPGIWSI